MAHTTNVVKDFDSLYSEVIDTIEEFSGLSEGEFEKELGELVDGDFLVRLTNPDDDQVLYTSKTGLNWENYFHIDSPLKKFILSKLASNPKAFFVLYNTQKGKMRIAAREVRSWASQGKVVAFVVVDNDKTLADQTVDGLLQELDDAVAKVFLLSSNSKTTQEQIQTYIDAYANDIDGDYKMPVIVALNNSDQRKRIFALSNHVQEKVTKRNSLLRNGFLFDEADKVYPPMREKFLPLVTGTAIHRVGWVTATDGDLMDADYPECANAQMFQPGDGDPNYRAFHHPDAVIHIVKHQNRSGNDSYAEKILEENRDHVHTQIKLKSGEMGFRKFIVNGPSKTENMRDFAMKRVADGCNAITINMFGIKVYRPGSEVKVYSFKGKKFNRALFDICIELDLGSRPLFIIGRRKVDRGVGFHYAPRDGSMGLVWTDMILGRITDKDTAVQKAGRLAGIIASCPQYSGQIHYWTDESTAYSIRNHNNVVDAANTKVGCSALQAVVRAKAEIAKIEENDGTGPASAKRSYGLSPTFDSVPLAKEWAAENLEYKVAEYKIHRDDDGNRCIRYRGDNRLLMSEAEVRNSFDPAEEGTIKHGRIMPVVDVGQGANKHGRIMPVLDLGWGVASTGRVMPVTDPREAALKYIVIYSTIKLKKKD